MILVDDAARQIDALSPIERALLCCIYETSSRRKLAGLVAAETADAIAGGLIRDERGQAAVAKFLEVTLEMHIDFNEGDYFEELREGRVTDDGTHA